MSTNLLEDIAELSEKIKLQDLEKQISELKGDEKAMAGQLQDILNSMEEMQNSLSAINEMLTELSTQVKELEDLANAKLN